MSPVISTSVAARTSAGLAAAAVMGFYAPPCVKRRVVVTMWRLHTHEDLTLLERSKRSPVEIKVANSKSCTGSFFQGI